MSQVDDRIVSLEFENRQFEQAAKESISTIDKLKKSLNFDDAAKNLQNFGKSTKVIDLSGLADNIERIKDRLSFKGLAEAFNIQKLVDFAYTAGQKIASFLTTPLSQIKNGGWRRAMNIEDAKFQLEGLKVSWESVYNDIDHAVAGTAFGLDVAAKACAQLSASGIQAGEDMKAALRGISGVAAMSNSTYEEISPIFTKAAGNGRVMADELNRISYKGLNAAAELSKFFSTIKENEDVPASLKDEVLALTDGLAVSESQVREFASKSKISFRMFSYAMDQAFGEHAKEANKTFSGALSNVNAALSKIGAGFAEGFIHNAIPVLNQVRILLNDLKNNMAPLWDFATKIMNLISGVIVRKLQPAIDFIEKDFNGLEHISNGLNNILKALARVLGAIATAFKEVFPPVKNVGSTINSAAEGFEKFTEALIPTDEGLIMFKDVLANILRVIKNVFGFLKGLLSPIGKLLGFLLKMAGTVLSVAFSFGKFIYSLAKSSALFRDIQKSGGLVWYVLDKIRAGFDYLSKAAKENNTILGKFINTVKTIAGSVALVLGGAIFKIGSEITKVFSLITSGKFNPFVYLSEKARNFALTLSLLFRKLKTIPVIGKVFGVLESVFMNIRKAIEQFVLSFNGFFKNLKTNGTVVGFFKAVIDKLKVSFKDFSDKLQASSGPFKKFIGFIKGLKDIPLVSATIENAKYLIDKIIAGVSKLIDLVKNLFTSTKSGADGAGSSVKPLMMDLSLMDKILQGLGTTLKIIGGVLAGALALAASVFNGLVTAIKQIDFGKIGEGFKDFINRIKDLHLIQTAIDAFKNSGGSLIAVFGALIGKVKEFFTGLKNDGISVLGWIGEKFTGLIKIIVGFFSGFSAGTDKMGGATSKFNRFLDSTKQKFGSFGEFVSTKLQEVRESGLLTKIMMVAYVAGIIKALWSIPTAIAKLSKSASGFFDGLTDNLKSLKGLTGLVGSGLFGKEDGFFPNLINVLRQSKEVQKKTNFELFGEMMRSLAISVAILAGAIGTLALVSKTADIGETAKILGIFVGAMVLIAGVITIISKRVKDASIFNAFAANIIGLSVAMVVLASAIAIMAKIEASNLKMGIAAMVIVVALMALMATAMHFITKMNLSAATFRSALMVIAFASSMYILASAVKKLATITVEDPSSLMYALIGCVASFGILVLLASKIKPASALAAVVIVGAMVLLFNTLKQLFAGGSLDLLTKYMYEARGTIATIIIIVSSLIVIMEVAITAINALILKTVATAGKGLALAGAGFAAFGAGILMLSIAVAKIADIDLFANGGEKLWRILTVFTIIAAIFAGVVFLSKKLDNVNKSMLTISGSLALLSLAILQVVIAAHFAEKLSIEPLLKALGILVVLGGLLAGMTFAAKAGSGTVGFKTVLAMILGVTLLIGALIVLALMCDNDEVWHNLLRALILIGGVLAGMSAILAFAGKIKTGQSWKPILTMVGMLAIIFGGLYLLSTQVQTLGDIGGLLAISAIVVGVIFALMKILEAFLQFSKQNNLGQGKAVQNAMIALGGMIGSFAIIAGSFAILDNFVTMSAGFVGKVAIAMVVLGGIVGLTILLVNVAKQMNASTSDLVKIGAVTGGLITALLAITGVLAVLDLLSLDNGLATKVLILSGVFVVLIAAVIALNNIGTVGVDTFKAIGVLGALTAAFTVLGLVFALLSSLPLDGMLEKSQMLTLVMAELIVMQYILGQIGADTESFKALGVFGAMVGTFTILGLVFALLSILPMEGLLAKSQMIVLVLAELTALQIILAKFGSGGEALMGVAGLTIMVALFSILAIVAMILQAVPVEGMLPKTQIVMLVMAELAAILIIMGVLGSYMAMALVGMVGLTIMVTLFTVLALVAVMLQSVPLDGMLAKTQIVMLVLFELAAIMVVLGIPAVTAFAALGMISAISLTLMVTVFGILSLICRLIISDMPLDGLLPKTQIIVLLLFELAAIMVVLGIPIVTAFAALGMISAVSLSVMIVVFGILALVCKYIISGIPMDGLLPKAQTIVLILLELAGIMVVLGVLSLYSIAGGASLIVLSFMLAIFTALALICKYIISDMPMDGVFEKVQMIILILGSLEAIVLLMGLLAPISMAAMVGIPALLAVLAAFVTIAFTLQAISGTDSGKMKAALDVIMSGLWQIMAIGVAGLVAGPGLIMIATAVAILGAACLLAGGGVMLFAMAISSLANTTPGQLAALQAVIMTFFNSVAAGVTNVGNSIVSTILMIGQAIVMAVNMVIIGVITAVLSGAMMLLSAAQMLGNSMVEGFKEKAMEIVKVPADILSALISGIGSIASSIIQAGVTMGSKLVEGFRQATGWYSPPEFLVKFFKDAGVTVNDKAKGITDLFEGTGEDWGSALSKGLKNTDWKKLGGDLIGNLTGGIKSGEGGLMSEINKILGMMGLISGANWNTAKVNQTKLDNQMKQLNSMKRAQSLYSEGSKGYERYSAPIKELTDSTEALKKEMAESANPVNALSAALDGFGESAKGAGGAAGGAADEMADFYGSLVDTLEGQMDIFSKFEEKEAMSKEELLSNMRSQIEGMTKWASNMQSLAAKGIDQGLYEKLAMMGPEGAQYVAAFNSMTAEELAQANSLWAQSLVLPSAISKQLTSSFSSIGTNIMQGWISGIDGNSEEYLTMLKGLAVDSHKIPEEELGIQSPSTVLYAIGAYMMIGLRDGIKAKWTLAQLALKFVCNQLVSDAKKLLPPSYFYTIGVGIIDGLTAGLQDEKAIERLAAQLEALAALIRASKSENFKENSPSKITEDIGVGLVEGLAKGIGEKHELVKDSMGDLADDTVNSMKSVISKIGEYLTEDIENPVITPVLDLSNVQAGAKTLNNMFSTNQAMLTSASLNDLQNEQQNGSRFGTTFIQNNYSPKALNRIEIYRQTRNQFAQYREAMQ